MTTVSKIDSNSSGLRWSKETSLGVADGSAVWYPFEPNTYSKFGADIKTIARNPINAGRQRFKGVTTDLDATGGFNTDLTQTNLQDILQGMFFAALRRKGEEVPTSVNGANAYLVASTAGFQVDDLVFASGFATAANTGLKNVLSLVANTSITVSQTLTTEATPPTGDNLVNVGHQFGSALLDVVAPGSVLPYLHNVAAKAVSTYTFTAPPTSGDTVHINGVLYTFVSSIGATPGNVYFTDAASACANLILAINAGAGAGAEYVATAVSPNADVVASAGAGTTVVITAKKIGIYGNAIATITSSTGAVGSWTSTVMASGTGVSFLDLGLIPGEWVYIGGDTSAMHFVNPLNNGWARIRSIADDKLTFDKTSSEMASETGTALTIQLFFGRVLKNESDPTLIVRSSYQLERTLGAPDDASPTQIQSEYLIGAVPNTFKMNFATANKITADLDFVAIDRESRSGATGVKAGTRPAISKADAFNTSSDFSRLKMTILNPLDSAPSALFAYLSAFDISISNGITPDKAISKLGAFDVTAGMFTVDGTATAYFADVAAVQAARNNSDVSIDFAVVKNNTVDSNTVAQGVLVDIPLMALAGASLNVVADKPIELPLTMAAGADRNFNHTLLLMFYDYLPAAAHP